MRHLSKTVKLDKSRLKNKIKFKIGEEKKDIKNSLNYGRKYDLMELLNNKDNTCPKIGIIVILAVIVAIEIIATILIIYFYDYIK